MEHGLAVALFAMVAALVAAVQARLRKRYWGLPSWCWTLYFAVIMILCRSAGAILVGALALVAIVWTPPRKQLWLAAALAAICLIYPCLRLTGFFPKDALVGISKSAISPDRAASLQVRFDNEELLMEHTRLRPWFGWGSYGRNRLYDEQGNNAVITDGHWIILLSAGGVMGLYGVFGAMLMSVFSALRLVRRVQERSDQQLLSGLALVTACYVFDLLPNGMFNRAPLFFAGALMSLCAAVRLGTGQNQASATWVLVTPVETPKVPAREDS
jgi:cell division protein FtsW (lipid II flippase)